MKRIPLAGRRGAGKFAIVDDEDHDAVSLIRWRLNPKGYAVGGDDQLMHRVINATPEGLETDHINGNRLDNRRGNLRSCTTGENRRNTGFSPLNKSGAKGVSWQKWSGRWRADIKLHRKSKYLGAFDTVAEASAAYERAAAELFGAFYRPLTNQQETVNA